MDDSELRSLWSAGYTKQKNTELNGGRGTDEMVIKFNSQIISEDKKTGYNCAWEQNK